MKDKMRNSENVNMKDLTPNYLLYFGTPNYLLLAVKYSSSREISLAA